MSSHDEPTRITVSRDALRADLAEMELRLRLYFDERISHKAESVDVQQHTVWLNDLRRGELTDAMRRAVADIVEDETTITYNMGWTKRERLIGVLAMILAVASFAFTVLVTATAPDPSPPTSSGQSTP